MYCIVFAHSSLPLHAQNKHVILIMHLIVKSGLQTDSVCVSGYKLIGACWIWIWVGSSMQPSKYYLVFLSPESSCNSRAVLLDVSKCFVLYPTFSTCQ